MTSSVEKKSAGWKANLLLALASFILTGSLFYAASIVYRSVGYYGRVRSDFFIVHGRIFVKDPDLGYATGPNLRAYLAMPTGPDIPLKHDEHGFRIPENSSGIDSIRRPLILALGCSYTHGTLCRAEETFPFKVAQMLGGTALNSSAPGHGLIQELIKAEKLIPEYRPDYVIVLYADWLVRRSTNAFAPTMSGLLPVPFFMKTKSGELQIHPPLFKPAGFDLPISDYQMDSTSSPGELASFVVRVGFPLYLHDDFNFALANLKNAWHRLFYGRPLFSANGLEMEITRHTHERIQEICAAHGSTLIMVAMRIHEGRVHSPLPRLNIPGAIFVDADSALMARLPEPSHDAYNRAYCHWGGSPPVMLDVHPNAASYQVMAEEITKAIREHESGAPPEESSTGR